MSTPDEPTRRIPTSDPQGPGAPPPREREREVIYEDPDWRSDIARELRSIRNALFAVGLIALLALGLGVYLLVNDDDDDGNNRNGASAGEVRDLDDRVDKLESQVKERAGEGAVEEIQQSQSEISDRLDALEEQAGQDDGDETAQLQQAIEDLTTEFQALSERVDSIEQEQQQQP